MLSASELANQHPRKALFTCVVCTNVRYSGEGHTLTLFVHFLLFVSSQLIPRLVDISLLRFA